MADDDAEKLKKQISVLSSLIQSHKQLKVKEKETKNYSWKNTQRNSKPSSRNDYNSLQTGDTSKHKPSTFSLDRRKHDSKGFTPLVSSTMNTPSVADSTTNSGRYKTTQTNKQEFAFKKGKDPLKNHVTLKFELESKLKREKEKDDSNLSIAGISNEKNSSKSFADTKSLSVRLSALSSSIAAAKLRMQTNSSIHNKQPSVASFSTKNIKTSQSSSTPSSTYTWVKGESENNKPSASASKASSELKRTKQKQLAISSRTKTESYGKAMVWRAKGSLKIDRRRRSSTGTRLVTSNGFMMRRQKTVQKNISKKNNSSRFKYIKSKRRSSSASEQKKSVTVDMPSSNKLQKLSQVKTKTFPKKAKRKSSKMLNISGKKYLMDATRRSLKRVQPENESQPSTSLTNDLLSIKRRVSSNKGQYQKSSTGSRALAIHAGRRSIQNALLYKYRKNAKSQQYCMFYNRFGKCNKGDKCPYIHDPSKIAVCTKFLQGKCTKTDGSCSFSHKIDKDKLPVCQFFLKDTCSNDNCPYSHVNVSSNAAVCQDFIKGYCPEGQQCKKKHIVDCEEFFQTGKCKKGKSCNLMHRVRKPGKRRKSSYKDSPQNTKKPKTLMTEEEGFLPLQLSHEPTTRESSLADASSIDKVKAIPIRPQFLLNKDNQGSG